MWIGNKIAIHFPARIGGEDRPDLNHGFLKYLHGLILLDINVKY